MSTRKNKLARTLREGFNKLAPCNQPPRYSRNAEGKVVEFNGYGKNAAKRKTRGV